MTTPEQSRLLVFGDILGHDDAYSYTKPILEGADIAGWLALPFTDEQIAMEELAPSIKAVAVTLSETAVEIGSGYLLVTSSGQLSIPTAVISTRSVVDEWIRPKSLDVSMERNPMRELPFRIASWLIRVKSSQLNSGF